MKPFFPLWFFLVLVSVVVLPDHSNPIADPAIAAIVHSFSTQQESEFGRLRREMVEKQIRLRGVNDQQVLEAMQSVPRHQFVPASSIDEAYEDHPVPIGYGQTISQPYIVAYMTELVRVSGQSKALEIGTGSGYQAAVLAEIADSVFTIEIIEPLGETADGRLKNLGYENIWAKIADGYYGWEEHAPYDVIVVTAAAEHVPPPLVEQLSDGGRMAIPVGHPFLVQTLILVEKQNGKITSRSILPVRFVPFQRRK